MTGKGFDLCGIDRVYIPAALTFFAVKSHAGTATSREGQALDLGSDSLRTIHRMFGHAKMRFPADTVLEATRMP